MKPVPSEMYKDSLREIIRFELRSAVYRLARLDRPRLRDGENYLHLGCGPNAVEGMVNADFFGPLRFWRSKRTLEWRLDLRYPLNCRDAVLDGVFTEHTLEHLYPDEAARLLGELFRVMKPGALIRVTVPDLEKYVDFYTGQLDADEAALFRTKFPTGAAAIRSLSQNYLHRALWDFEELKRYLEQAGFRDVQRKKFGECSDSRLCADLKDRAWETLYVEARKTKS